ncbi:DNA repair exonuclease [Nosocomiicoccus sp. HMSC09A07]|uniref:metallophosphoesterase family protein n=1 Tax=Nosocomiicoccus sp. HMSC09A07 TaxID=1581145 RepID=UPI0008A3A073|nr:DNA repair exonuclease [Nosocomiicoccus sp. HMSC09A07]OFS64610.1 DNA repair exonuclease [Nosocomiicoccus sp. HMSC09A07]
MVKFIHAADLHLDSPFKSRSELPPHIVDRLMESTYNATKRMIDYAIKEKVDFIIIAGDVFDQKNRTLKSEIFLKEQFQRLEDNGIFTYMIHGNHDPLDHNVKTSWPSTVHVFKENIETYQLMSKDNEKIFLHGFSYLHDETYENKIDHYPVNNRNDGIHIGILHGTYSKSNTKSKRYTEFTLEDLRSKLYHYWALGHIHQRQELSDMPLINYAGNIQGRHMNETGEKGFYIVSGDHVHLYSTFVSVEDIQFERYDLEVNNIYRDELYRAVTEYKNKLRKEGSRVIELTVYYDGEEDISGNDYYEILSLLQEDERDVEDFVWIDRLYIEQENPDQNALLTDIKNSFKDDDDLYKTALNTLYMDPKVNKFLPPMEDIDKEKLLELGEARLKLLMRK